MTYCYTESGLALVGKPLMITANDLAGLLNVPTTWNLLQSTIQKQV